MTKKTPTPHTGCPLCRLYEEREITTKFHFENAQVIIVDCKTCGVPMIVLKRHTDNPSQSERREMYRVAIIKVPEREHTGLWILDRKMRSIPDHVHYHLRKMK